MSEAEILAIINQLNAIEVHGEKNLDTLLAVIEFLKGKAAACRQQRLKPKEPEPKEPEVVPVGGEDG